MATNYLGRKKKEKNYLGKNKGKCVTHRIMEMEKLILAFYMLKMNYVQEDKCGDRLVILSITNEPQI